MTTSLVLTMITEKVSKSCSHLLRMAVTFNHYCINNSKFTQ